VDTVHPLGPCVLIVDDCPTAADSAALLLKRWGYRAVLAYDGPSALAAALTQPPAAVLLDIGMPGMDGYEVARRLRGRPWTERALLIALTGYGQEEDMRRCWEAGFDLHLLKPYEPEELHGVLHRGLAARPARPHEPPSSPRWP
jgi:CheY-like chemotaxis protein